VLILGVETATERVSVALGGHDGVLGLVEIERGRRHAESLVPAIDFLCSQADVTLDEVGTVAVDVGPGLFTGMRVGIATAKAIALAQRVPMVGISSLDLLAFGVHWSERVVAAVIDARKGEVFYSFYKQVPGGTQQLLEPRCGSVDDLVADILARGQEVLCVGDGALRYEEQIRSAGHVEMAEQWLSRPSAGPLVQLAHARAIREETVDPIEIQPLYLRLPDAQINWVTRSSPGTVAR
jgi:tRNA threonylcarbamoyladenosine biosynthesis protein TsaB